MGIRPVIGGKAVLTQVPEPEPPQDPQDDPDDENQDPQDDENQDPQDDENQDPQDDEKQEDQTPEATMPEPEAAPSQSKKHLQYEKVSEAEVNELRKNRLEKGSFLPITSWYNTTVKTEHTSYNFTKNEVKKLMQSAGAGASKYSTFPLMTLYSNRVPHTIKVDGERNAVETEVAGIYKKFSVSEDVQKIFDEPDRYNFEMSFPMVIGERIAGIGWRQAKQEWLFTKRDATEATAEEIDAEKYYIRAIIDFFAKGFEGTSYVNAEDTPRAIFEGRFGANTESKLYLFHQTEPFFKHLRATQSQHPTQLIDFLKIREESQRSSGTLFYSEFNELVKIYNQNLHAKITAELQGKTWKDKDKDTLKIRALGSGDPIGKKNFDIATQQWVIYTLLTNKLRQYNKLEKISMGEIRGNFQKIEESLDTLLKVSVHDDRDFNQTIETLTDMLAEYANPTIAWTPKKKDDKTLIGFFNLLSEKGKEISRKTTGVQKTTYELLKNLLIYHKYLRTEVTVESLAHDALPLLQSAEAFRSTQQFAKDGKMRDNRDYEKLATEYAEQARHLLFTIYDPVIYMTISYALLTLLLRRYVIHFLGRLMKSCTVLRAEYAVSQGKTPKQGAKYRALVLAKGEAAVQKLIEENDHEQVKAADREAGNSNPDADSSKAEMRAYPAFLEPYIGRCTGCGKEYSFSRGTDARQQFTCDNIQCNKIFTLGEAVYRPRGLCPFCARDTPYSEGFKEKPIVKCPNCERRYHIAYALDA